MNEIDRLLAILDRADPPAVLDNVEALATALRRLREALMYYSLATVVSSWGYEELGPDWEVARTALGLPDLTPEEQRDALGIGEPYEEDS